MTCGALSGCTDDTPARETANNTLPTLEECDAIGQEMIADPIGRAISDNATLQGLADRLSVAERDAWATVTMDAMDNVQTRIEAHLDAARNGLTYWRLVGCETAMTPERLAATQRIEAQLFLMTVRGDEARAARDSARRALRR